MSHIPTSLPHQKKKMAQTNLDRKSRSGQETWAPVHNVTAILKKKASVIQTIFFFRQLCNHFFFLFKDKFKYFWYFTSFNKDTVAVPQHMLWNICANKSKDRMMTYWCTHYWYITLLFNFYGHQATSKSHTGEGTVIPLYFQAKGWCSTDNSIRLWWQTVVLKTVSPITLGFVAQTPNGN